MLANLLDVISWIIFVPLVIALGIRAYAKSEERRLLVGKWIASAVLIAMAWGCSMLRTQLKALFMLVPLVILGMIWIRDVLTVVLRPLTSAFDGGATEVEPAPFYYLAEGKRRQGLFQEAIAEVEKQLEKFPNDPPGILLRATIEAEDLHNLHAARATLERLLAQQNLTAPTAATALNTLADWQLQTSRDVAGARATLQRLAQLYPNSPTAHAAEQRLAHLEGTAAAREARENVKYQMPPPSASAPSAQPAAETDPGELADELVAQLKRFPNDTETREKLALLYVNKFQRLDLALAQLEQLVSLPNETPKHIAHWLNLMATLQIKHGHDLKGAEAALHRILERFPKTAMANIAFTRLASLQAELKAGESAAVKPLGVYERGLGLKKGAS